jgi:putative addiction module killer protein
MKVNSTHYFNQWLASLRNREAKRIIRTRIDRISESGNLGDYKPVGDGVFEIRIDFGPGFRIYFLKLGTTIILLLCGGDKSSQKNDVQTAKTIARRIKEKP